MTGLAAEQQLEGKVAIVTGSGRGIGRAVAIKLASYGAKLVINDLDPAVGDAVVAEIHALGGEAVSCNGNVTHPDFAERFISSATANFGGLDIIVNNAGYTWDATIGKATDEQFQAMLDVHLVAPFRILRQASAVLRKLHEDDAANGRKRLRKVVNVTSISGLSGTIGQVAYSSAKAGVIGLTKTLSKEWGRFGINVNAVAFGLIDTRLTVAAQGPQNSIEIEGKQIAVGVNPELRERWKDVIPLGRAGTADEAAGAVVMLCGTQADYISGQVILCAGGLVA